MKGKHFLFVESNTTGTGALAVTRLLESGARVTFLARQPDKYPFLTAPAPGLSVVVLDTNDINAVAAFVAGVRQQRGSRRGCRRRSRRPSASAAERAHSNAISSPRGCARPSSASTSRRRL